MKRQNENNGDADDYSWFRTKFKVSKCEVSARKLTLTVKITKVSQSEDNGGEDDDAFEDDRPDEEIEKNETKIKTNVYRLPEEEYYCRIDAVPFLDPKTTYYCFDSATKPTSFEDLSIQRVSAAATTNSRSQATLLTELHDVFFTNTSAVKPYANLVVRTFENLQTLDSLEMVSKACMMMQHTLGRLPFFFALCYRHVPFSMAQSLTNTELGELECASAFIDSENTNTDEKKSKKKKKKTKSARDLMACILSRIEQDLFRQPYSVTVTVRPTRAEREWTHFKEKAAREWKWSVDADTLHPSAGEAFVTKNSALLSWMECSESLDKTAMVAVPCGEMSCRLFPTRLCEDIKSTFDFFDKKCKSVTAVVGSVAMLVDILTKKTRTRPELSDVKRIVIASDETLDSLAVDDTKFWKAGFRDISRNMYDSSKLGKLLELLGGITMFVFANCHCINTSELMRFIGLIRLTLSSIADDNRLPVVILHGFPVNPGATGVLHQWYAHQKPQCCRRNSQLNLCKEIDEKLIGVADVEFKMAGTNVLVTKFPRERLAARLRLLAASWRAAPDNGKMAVVSVSSNTSDEEINALFGLDRDSIRPPCVCLQKDNLQAVIVTHLTLSCNQGGSEYPLSTIHMKDDAHLLPLVNYYVQGGASGRAGAIRMSECPIVPLHPFRIGTMAVQPATHWVHVVTSDYLHERDMEIVRLSCRRKLIVIYTDITVTVPDAESESTRDLISVALGLPESPVAEDTDKELDDDEEEEEEEEEKE